MAFIKVQKLVLSEDGNVISGSAAVVDTIYDSSVNGRSHHRIREKLLKDIMSTIVYLKIQKALSSIGLSMSKLFGRAPLLLNKEKGRHRNRLGGQ